VVVSQLLRGIERDGAEAYMIGVYGGLIAVAEVCFSFLDPVAGTIIYAVTLLVMLTDAVTRGPRSGVDDGVQLDATRAVVALAFLPVVRLVSIMAPLGAGSTAGKQLLVAALLLVAVGWGAWGLALPLPSLRPTFGALEIGVVASAVPLLLVAHYVIAPGSLADSTRWTQLALAGIAACAAAVVEELIFRGFIQRAFSRLYGSGLAPLLATSVYLIAYVGVRPALLIPYAVILGVLFGWIVERSNSLFGVTLSHSVVNVGLFVVLPSARHVSG
jgi:membrane protease YdiL (CAAX protease family)